MNPAIAHVTKKRGKILLHQIMVKFAHKCLSYTLARGEMNVIFFSLYQNCNIVNFSFGNDAIENDRFSNEK